MGAAAAGLVANRTGFTASGDAAGLREAAFWTSACFGAVAALAALPGARLAALRRRAEVS